MTLNQFLKNHSYITAAGIAAKAGISYQSIRLEIEGKYCNAERLQMIEAAIHKIGEELQQVKLTCPE